MVEKKLIRLIRKKNILALDNFLKNNSKKIDKNYKDSKGRSILIIACESRSVNVLETICKYLIYNNNERITLDEAFIYCCQNNLSFSTFHILNSYKFKINNEEKIKLLKLLDIAKNNSVMDIIELLNHLLTEMQDKLNEIKNTTQIINNGRFFKNIVYKEEYEEFDSKLLFEGLITFIPKVDFYSNVKNENI